METLVHILIISDNEDLVKQVQNLVNHPQVIVDSATIVPQDQTYNFYILGGPRLTDAIDRIREFHEDSDIYLSGSVCTADVPIRKMIKCNIVGCLESEDEIRYFAQKVDSFRKQKCRLREVSCTLDRLKAGDLKDLTRQLKKAESEKFVDYIQNHPLPMVLVSREYDVLHANKAMEDMIGTRLSGASAASYYVDSSELEDVVIELEKKGQVLGVTVTLKNIDGESFPMKIYTSLHRDRSGNWLNTRCLFVPIEECPE